MPTITLLTDFGTKDEYVGVMKGVILSIAPNTRVVDLTHEIDPQDVIQGAYILDSAVDYFPAGSIHLAVVDPGVGGSRAAVAVRRGPNYFVAPDNGLLSLIIAKGVDAAVRIENDLLFRKPVSNTFHGRDIFAPTAAHLSIGKGMEKLGPTIPSTELIRLRSEILEQTFPDRIKGVVVAIDRFGNLMTNITSRSLEIFYTRWTGKEIRICINSVCIAEISKTYGQVDEQKILALIGSRGYLEISVNQASAAERLNASKGDRVDVLILDTDGNDI